MGIIASLLGGAVFAAVMAAIGFGVYYELSKITPLIGLGFRLHVTGYGVVFAGASIALLSREDWAIALFGAVAMLLPTAMIFRMPANAEAFSSWVATLGSAVYIALPVFASISLRRDMGTLDMSWADDLGSFFTLSGASTALGMAWCMMAITATWLGDTLAMVIGRSMGRTPLIPHISPNKTLEGASGAVLGAAIATVMFDIAFGIPGLSASTAIVLGVLFAVVGICGDLMESFIKRSGGVKDSGTLIPGHGGLFDRVDGLMPTLLVAWIAFRFIY